MTLNESLRDDLESMILKDISSSKGGSGYTVRSLQRTIDAMSDTALNNAVVLLQDNLLIDTASTSDFIYKGVTDAIVFAGIDISRHPRGIASGLHRVAPRYAESDLLELPIEAVFEARLIAAVTNLLLEGMIYDGSDNVSDNKGDWYLNNAGLLDLLQRRTHDGDRILRVMREQHTAVPQRIEEVLEIAQPLESGLL